MTNVTVVGAQWGDEGKGKIVDWLSNQADIVVRFQGGNNAGHTIVVKKKKIALSLLPSGIIRAKKMSIIGNGVVVNPTALLQEIKKLGKAGIKISRKNLRISENASIIFSFHKKIDDWNDTQSKRPHASIVLEIPYTNPPVASWKPQKASILIRGCAPNPAIVLPLS